MSSPHIPKSDNVLACSTAGHGLELHYPELTSEETVAATALFEHAGYLALPGLLPEPALNALRGEVARLLDRAKRRDFQMECMGGTPRHMTTLGGLEIAEMAPVISDLYFDARLSDRLAGLSGLELVPADDPVERHVLNVLHRSGDTHGLHTDDYPLALVLFLESPSCEAGCGHLEFFGTCTAGHSSVKSHTAGDAYLLRADKFPPSGQAHPRWLRPHRAELCIRGNHHPHHRYTLGVGPLRLTNLRTGSLQHRHSRGLYGQPLRDRRTRHR